jgi:hypothetical protein
VSLLTKTKIQAGGLELAIPNGEIRPNLPVVHHFLDLLPGKNALALVS